MSTGTALGREPAHASLDGQARGAIEPSHAGKPDQIAEAASGLVLGLNDLLYWLVPEHAQLRSYGMAGWNPKQEKRKRSRILRFSLGLTSFCAPWQGRLTISWPPPELSWWRWAHRKDMPVIAILEDSLFVDALPAWDEVDLKWDELGILPRKSRETLAQWRGIYYILDDLSGKGYVGSACGGENLLGRWENYAATGHGGNELLKDLDPSNFRFTILQLVSPTLERETVIQLEASWKRRLHTLAPRGLNRS